MACLSINPPNMQHWHLLFYRSLINKQTTNKFTKATNKSMVLVSCWSPSQTLMNSSFEGHQTGVMMIVDNIMVYHGYGD